MKVNKLAKRFLSSPAGFTNKLPASVWLLALPFALVAALAMPRQSAFPYVFQVGQPWNYRDLKAPFDFEVMYPEDQVRPAVDQINAEHGPYFLLNTEIARQQKRQFAQLIADQISISRHDAQYDDLRANTGMYLNFGQQMLDFLYAQGIADPNEEAFKTTAGFVFVVVGNTERRVSVREVRTASSAMSFLADTLPYTPLRQPELMLPMFEKALTPNLQFSDSLTIASLRKKLAAVMSTGITVRKEEVVVHRNELVTNDIYLKLHSLHRRYEEPKGWLVTVGYGLLAWFAFSIFLFWFAKSQQAHYPTRRAQLLPSMLALLGIVAIGFGSRVAAAVPLLWPLWVLPVLLRRTYSLTVSLGIWGVVVFLTAISLDWSAGWLVIQGMGMAASWILLLPGSDEGWRVRTLAVVYIAGLQTLAGVAAGWAGKIPDVLWTTDSSIFLFAAAAFSLLAFPLSAWMARQLQQSSGNDSA